jgi:hypothetical protein
MPISMKPRLWILDNTARVALGSGWAAILLSVIAGVCAPVETAPLKTRVVDPGATPYRGAKICDVSWLAGHWIWTGPDGALSEEIWSPAIGGTMIGSFRSTKNGDPVFYELMLLSEEEGSLTLRLRHFHPDLKAWDQEHDEAVRYQLVYLDARTAYFEGLTFESVHPDRLAVYLRVHDTEQGKVSEKSFEYRRVEPRQRSGPCS